MFPLIWVGAAMAAVFLSGCHRKTEEPAKPEPADPRPSFNPPPSEEPKAPSMTPRAAESAVPESAPPKKMSDAELREMAEGLKKCLKVQQSYGLRCPPPKELPPGCTCEEVDLPPELDPAYPQKVRNILIPPSEPKTLPNI